MMSLKFIARVGSLFSIALLLLFLLGSGFHPSQIKTSEWVGLTFFPCGLVVGLIISWWREGLGSAISLASLLAFYVVYGFFLGNQIRGLAFIAFAVPGFLFFLYWLMSKPNFREAIN